MWRAVWSRNLATWDGNPTTHTLRIIVLLFKIQFKFKIPWRGPQIGLACVSIRCLERSKGDFWLQFQQTTSIAFCLVAESCLTLWNPMDYRMPDCPSLSPRVCSDSCPLSWWCYLTISSSAALFSFCLQHFPASGSLPMSWLFTSCGQSIGASASITPMTIQGWFPKYSLLIHLQTLRQKYNSCLTKFKHWIIMECILS